MYLIRRPVRAVYATLIVALLFLLQPPRGEAQSVWVICPGDGLGPIKFGEVI